MSKKLITGKARARLTSVKNATYSKRRLPRPNKLSLYFLPLLFVLIFCIVGLVNEPVGFDEGYNLQVSNNFAAHGEYASNGALFGGGSKLFDPYISTGPTLLMPIALMFKFFGTGVWQYRVLTGVLLALLIALIALTIIKVGTRAKASLPLVYSLACLVPILALTTGTCNSDASNTLFSATGEVLALCLALLAAWALKRHAFTAGLLLGLAILTKTIFFLALPALLFSIILLGSRGRTRHFRLWSVTKSGLGVALPLISFELYRLASFNFSVAAYKANIREYIEFFKMGGSGMSPSTPNVLNILKDKAVAAMHLSPQFDSLAVKVALVAATLYGAYMLFLLVRKISLPEQLTFALRDPILLFLGGTTVTWLTWWLFVSNSSLIRHIMPAVILIFITTAGVIIYTYRTVLTPRMRPIGLSLVCLLLAALSLSFAHQTRHNGGRLHEQRKEIAAVRQFYENRKLYHTSWWQNPEAQFILGARSHPAEQGVGDKYVLMSNLQNNLAPTDYASYKKHCSSYIKITTTYQICLLKPSGGG